MRSQVKRDGGDDDGDDGAAARKRALDLRTSSIIKLPQKISSWLES
jgi:hypothetical protein